MSTDAEKLAQITALCDEMAQSRGGARHAADELRAILAEPGPAVPPHAIDRDALLEVLVADWTNDTLNDVADAILALVRPVEPVAFTRDRVRAELLASLPADPKWATWVDGVLDRLELPGGVTLSREDASLAAYFVRDHIGTGWADPIWPTDDHLRALVARLEGASS